MTSNIASHAVWTRLSFKLLARALKLVPALVGLAMGASFAEASGGGLTLDEAVARALAKNEGLVVERASVASSQAGISGARGVYDPLLGLEGEWRRASTPVNSAFSGAPAGEPAPTLESATISAVLQQLLPSGGQLTARSLLGRRESDASFDLLSPAYDSQLGLEFRQPLLRNRSVDSARLGLRVAAVDYQRAAAGLRREVSELVAGVERAYWDLVAAQQGVVVRREAIDLAKEQLAETEIRIESGASPETEIAQPRSELERRRGEFLSAQERVARAESRLKLWILSDSEESQWLEPLPLSRQSAVEVEPVAAVAAMNRALDARPELASAAAFVERRRLEGAFARDGIKPSLDLVVSYDRFGFAGSANSATSGIPGLPSDIPEGLEGDWRDSAEGLLDSDFDEARVALVFEVPIGNRAARAAAARAENSEVQAEAELARARKVVRAQVLDAVARLQAAGGRIEAARAAREAAEVQLDTERERFAVGLSTNFLVLTRQNDLSSARLDEIAASTDYLSARTELGRATGSLLEDRGIEVQEK